MNAKDQAYFESISTLTSYPEWAILVEELKREIYQTQSNILQSANDWDTFNVAKGWAGGLAYIINLRENNIKAMRTASEQAKAADFDADV